MHGCQAELPHVRTSQREDHGPTSDLLQREIWRVWRSSKRDYAEAVGARCRDRGRPPPGSSSRRSRVSRLARKRPGPGSQVLSRAHCGHRTEATPPASTDSTGTDGQSTPSRTSPGGVRQERQVQRVVWLMAAPPAGAHGYRIRAKHAVPPLLPVRLGTPRYVVLSFPSARVGERFRPRPRPDGRRCRPK